MIEVRPLPLEGAYEIIPKKFGDERGFFSETFNASVLKEHGIDIDFVQDNHSFSATKGVLRGLHFQNAPFAQDKLVRVTRGSAYDVLVDLRKEARTYKQWVGVEVSAEKWNQVLIPKGFAHGFLTLEDNTEFLYKVSDFYAPEADRNIRFDDPDIKIDWLIDHQSIQLSGKDEAAPRLADIQNDIRF